MTSRRWPPIQAAYCNNLTMLNRNIVETWGGAVCTGAEENMHDSAKMAVIL